MTALAHALNETADLINQILARLIPLSDGEEKRLQHAMRYSSLDGGKRLRPFLVLQSAALFNVSPVCAQHVAAAIEMVHCYSLAHDDLPAMDDDDLRRGRPTCHMAFDEATAILAGDALLTKAFEVLANEDTHADPAIRCELVAELARAAGDHGMVGGQMLDLMAAGLSMDVPAVTRLQQLKTGKLIGFSTVSGAILGKAPFPLRQALQRYARDLGLAFQIADDLLDIEGSEAETGKAVHKDKDAGKATFASLLGVDQARTQAELLSRQAVGHLDCFDEKADLLRDVAAFVVKRKN